MTPTKFFGGARVAVTGAGGSIGSEICRALVQLGVTELRMIGHSELPLYQITNELMSEYNRISHAPQYKAGKVVLTPVLASVGDEYAMQRALRNVDIVIHAAAHKHVPLCEQNPLEAIINNIGGTQTLIAAAAKAGVKNFVQVSTDKAVRPTSVMGMTKRACELFMQMIQERVDMKFTVVRFGNVLNSSGSVLPLWREQLKAGKPITLTDRRCTRYFMSIPEAVKLTLSAAALDACQGVFVLDMGQPQSIYELARRTVVEHFRDDEGMYISSIHGALDNHIVETGLRPGEKLEEELTYGGPTEPTEVSRVLRVKEAGTWHQAWVVNDIVLAAKAGAKDCALAALRRLCL
jgi:FlaA1/EpsC-like NDP-sugar epimerase